MLWPDCTAHPTVTSQFLRRRCRPCKKHCESSVIAALTRQRQARPVCGGNCRPYRCPQPSVTQPDSKTHFLNSGFVYPFLSDTYGRTSRKPPSLRGIVGLWSPFSVHRFPAPGLSSAKIPAASKLPPGSPQTRGIGFVTPYYPHIPARVRWSLYLRWGLPIRSL